MILNLLPVAITWQDITIAWYFITTGDMVQRKLCHKSNKSVNGEQNLVTSSEFRKFRTVHPPTLYATIDVPRVLLASSIC